MAWALPAIPDKCLLVKVIYLKPPNDSFMMQTFAFRADVTPLIFNMRTAFDFDFPGWIVNATYKTFALNTPPVSALMVYNYNGGTHSTGPFLGFFTWTMQAYPAPCLSTRLCAQWIRSTGLPGRSYSGRVASAPIPNVFLDGSRISFTGKGFLDTAATAQLATWFSQGVTFTPSLWSQKLGVNTLLNNVKCNDLPTTIYKRRPYLPYVKHYAGWPLIP